MPDETEDTLYAAVPLAWDAHHAPFYASKENKEHRKRKPWLAATATLCFAAPQIARWAKSRGKEGERGSAGPSELPPVQSARSVPEVQPTRHAAGARQWGVSSSLPKILSIARTSSGPLIFDKDLVLARVDEVLQGLDRLSACLDARPGGVADATPVLDRLVAGGDEFLSSCAAEIGAIEDAVHAQGEFECRLVEVTNRDREHTVMADAAADVLRAKLDQTLEDWARDREARDRAHGSKMAELERQRNEALHVLANVQSVLECRGARVKDLEELAERMQREAHDQREASSAESRRFKVTLETLEAHNARLAQENSRLNDQVLAFRGAAMAAEVGGPLRERRTVARPYQVSD